MIALAKITNYFLIVQQPAAQLTRAQKVLFECCVILNRLLLLACLVILC